MNRSNKLTSVKPRPPAVPQSDPVWTCGQFRQSDVRMYSHERGEIAVVPQTLVPRIIPRQEHMAVDHVTGCVVVEIL